MIVGLTHDPEGKVLVSRAITTKVSIGRAPDERHDYPQVCSHFNFWKRAVVDGTLEWVLDDELMELFAGPRVNHRTCQCCPVDEQRARPCTEVMIVLMDDDVETIFPAELAAFVQRGRWCHGDGINAERRERGRDGQDWGPFEAYGPCYRDGCPEVENGRCGVSSDLYFILADRPTLGAVCRIHTGSWASTRQLHSALHDMKRVAGRLMGLRCRLFVQPENSRYRDNRDRVRTGIKYVLGLDLRAQDMADLQDKMLEAARTLQAIRAELGGQTIKIIEPESERGDELTPEFYPSEEQQEQKRAEEDAETPDRDMPVALSDLERELGVDEHETRRYVPINPNGPVEMGAPVAPQTAPPPVSDANFTLAPPRPTAVAGPVAVPRAQTPVPAPTAPPSRTERPRPTSGLALAARQVDAHTLEVRGEAVIVMREIFRLYGGVWNPPEGSRAGFYRIPIRHSRAIEESCRNAGVTLTFEETE